MFQVVFPGLLLLFSGSMAIHSRAHALRDVADHRAKRVRLTGLGVFVVVDDGRSPHLLMFPACVDYTLARFKYVLPFYFVLGMVGALLSWF